MGNNNLKLITPLSDTDIMNHHMNDGVVVALADEHYTVIESNEGYHKLIGYSREEIRDLFQNQGAKTIHPDDLAVSIDNFKTQLAESDDGSFRLKLRLVQKIHGWIWVMFNGKVTPDGRICFTIIDITESQKAIDNLEQEYALTKLITAMGEDSYWDIDINSGSIKISEGFAERFRLPTTLKNYPNSLIDRKIIGQDSLELIKNYPPTSLKDIETYVPTNDAELHFITADGTNVWYSCQYSYLYDKDGDLKRVVVKLSDITKQRLRIGELETRAERDQLTGLYNKTTTETLIKDALQMRRSTDEKCALIIIDVDNFKEINDTFGHLYGDTVLAELGDLLAPLFRSSDIVGRIGGDEFFVFLKNYKNRKIITKKAEDVIRLFRRSYTEDDFTVEISASVGISLCPEQGVDFDDLYRYADIALYSAKEKGKNMFSYYTASLAPNYRNRRTEIETTTGKTKRIKVTNRVEQLFSVLNEATNINDGINEVLSMLAGYYNFTRAYIYEPSVTKNYLTNTFEWVAHGIMPRMVSDTESVPEYIYADAFERFRTQDWQVLLRSEMDKPENRNAFMREDVMSAIRLPIHDGEKLIGFIGFDDHINERKLAADELRQLSMCCQVIITFLLKKFAKTELGINLPVVYELLSQLDTHAYVVDMMNYELLFYNNLLDSFSTAFTHTTCYSYLRSRVSPCEECPLASMDADNLVGQSSYIHPILQKKICVNAKVLEWSSHSRICLLTATVEGEKD